MLVPPLHHEVVTATPDSSHRRDLEDARRRFEQVLAELERRLRPRRRPGSASPSPGGCRTSDRFVPAAARQDLPHDGGRASPRCSTPRGVPERPGRDRARAERHRDPAAQRRARAHRRRGSSGSRDAGLLHRHEPAPRLRGRRLRRRQVAAARDGARRERPRRRPDPGGLRALPRLHLHPEGGVRAREDRELRDARLRRPSRQRLLPRGDAHAPLATSPRISRPGTSTSRSTSASRPRSGPASTSRRTRRSSRGARAGLRPRRRPPPVPPDRPDRPQRVDPGDLAPRRPSTGPDGTHYPKGTAIPIRADFNTLDNPFLFSEQPHVIQAGPDGGDPLPRRSTRRATTSTATGSRWTASSRTAASRSSRATAARASTRS